MGGRGGSFASYSSRSDAYNFFGVGSDKGTYENWYSSIDREEESQLNKYTGSWYWELNDSLRNSNFYDNLSPITQMAVDDSVAAMDTAIAKFDLKKNLTVYRGSSSHLVMGYGTAEEINANLKGAIVMDKAYMSTSADKKSHFDGEIQYEIQVPKGKGRGAFVAPISEFKSEDEFLLKRGTKFKVLGAKNRNGQVVVKLRVVD